MEITRRWRSKRRCRSSCWPVRRSSPALRSGRLGPSPAREDRRRQAQPTRFLAYRHLAHLDGTAQIAERLPDELADCDRRHADGIDGQHEEAAVLVEKPAAVDEERREVFLQ